MYTPMDESGVASVVAQTSKEMSHLIVGVVAYPFSFEGRERSLQALEAIEKLQKKWNDICQRLSHTQPFPKANFY